MKDIRGIDAKCAAWSVPWGWLTLKFRPRIQLLALPKQYPASGPIPVAGSAVPVMRVWRLPEPGLTGVLTVLAVRCQKINRNLILCVSACRKQTPRCRLLITALTTIGRRFLTLTGSTILYVDFAAVFVFLPEMNALLTAN